MVAVEIGFGDVKVIGEGIKLKFPTVIAYARGGALKQWNDDNLSSYRFGSKRYIVGQDALYSGEMFSSRDPKFLIDFAPLFIYKAFEQTGIRPDTVALGLAVGYYSAKDRLLRRVRSFEVNEERIELNCSVFPQAVGIWLDWSSNNSDRSNGNYMVLDIGFNTVDMIFIRNGSVSKEGSWMMEGEGTVKIVKHLADFIQQKLSIQLTPPIAKALFERKSLIVYGKERSLDRIIAGLSSDYAQRLFFLLQDRCGEEFRNLDGIIIGGGGAYYIRDSIPKQLRGIVEVVEEPEFANARGFYKSLKEKDNENKTQ